MLYTTFRKAHEGGACASSYKKYAKHVGGIRKFGKDTPVPITEILDVLGVDDAYWCLYSTIEPRSEAQYVILEMDAYFLRHKTETKLELLGATELLRGLLTSHIEH